MKHFSLKTILLTSFLAVAGIFGVTASVVGADINNNPPVVEKAEAAVSKTVTRVYIEDQVTTTPILAIESISFASGYDHTTWRAFLTSYLGARSSYTTTSGTSMPSSKGWSYMSSSEQEKYLLCPSGSKNFTMIFPEWVTAFSYKAVGNNWWNWFDVNGSAVGLHSGWGIGKKVNSYIYNDSGWKMNANLDNTAQTNTWGDITLTAIASYNGSKIAEKKITMSKYYIAKSQSYGDIFGYTTSDKWYKALDCSTEHTSLITANTTVYNKLTVKKVAYLQGTMNSWTDNDSYVLSPTVDDQYFIDISLSKDSEFKIHYKDGTNVWYGWSQVDPDSSALKSGAIIEGSDPDSTGSRIKVNTATTYEIYFKVNNESNKLWIQLDSNVEADLYAQEFLTTITCTGQGSTSFSMNSWNIVGEATNSMEYKFNHLTIGAQGKITGATASQSGTNVQKMLARYDAILSKYGYGTSSDKYHDYLNRQPEPLGAIRSFSPFRYFTNDEDNLSTIIIIAASSVSLLSLTALGVLILKKRKSKTQ